MLEFAIDLALKLLIYGHKVRLVYKENKIGNGDICFILGYSKIVNELTRKKNLNNIVVHESELPLGKGWSPMTWQILEKKKEITFSLFEAIDKVDAGKVYINKSINIDPTDFIDEWREKQGNATIDICLEFIRDYPNIIKNGKSQKGRSTYYRKRTVKDSEIKQNQTFVEQQEIFRVLDNVRYNGWLKLNGRKINIFIAPESN